MAPTPKRRRSHLTPGSNATTATATASMDRFLKSALAMADPSVSIGLSLERIHDSSPLQSDKESLIDGATRVAYALIGAARKLAATHNSSAWPLSADLTIKVFLMLDTESICCAAATCSLFNKCASDPLCYANIDLTRNMAKVSNQVVSTMIQRAGNNLQSIKLGSLHQDETLDESSLTGSCLSALVWDGGASGLLLRGLHLYNLEMQAHDLCIALSACQSLAELEIVGVQIGLDKILSTVSKYCHSIERLCLDARAIGFNRLGLLLQHHDIENLVKMCPLLSSLALRGYEIGDNLLSVLIQGASGLKSLDLSGSYGFSGAFLRDGWFYRDSGGGAVDSVETLILRDCRDLFADKIVFFLTTVLNGDWKALRYVDVSNRRGLLAFRGYDRPRTRCALDVSEILHERPDVHLIADYPPKLCFYGDCSDSCDACSHPPSSSSDAASSSDDDDTS